MLGGNLERYTEELCLDAPINMGASAQEPIRLVASSSIPLRREDCRAIVGEHILPIAGSLEFLMPEQT